MKRLLVPGQFLRRKDVRRRIDCPAAVEFRGISRTAKVVDFSMTGLRLDGLTGLVTGDRITILFTPDLSIDGSIAWLVWHKAGVRFVDPLTETDPVCAYLLREAALFEHARVRVIAALAQQEAIKAAGTDSA
jgi:hypothetical protein